MQNPTPSLQSKLQLSSAWLQPRWTPLQLSINTLRRFGQGSEDWDTGTWGAAAWRGLSPWVHLHGEEVLCFCASSIILEWHFRHRPPLRPPTRRWDNICAATKPPFCRSREALATQGEVQLEPQVHPDSALAASQEAETKGYVEEKWVFCQSCMVRTGWLPNFPNSHSWVYPAKWNGNIQIILLIGTANFLVLLSGSPLLPTLKYGGWWTCACDFFSQAPSLLSMVISTSQAAGWPRA